MNHTIHSMERAQQRGLGDTVLSIIDCYGEDIKSSNGSVIRRIPHHVLKELKHELSGTLYRHLLKKNKAYMVKDSGKVVTVGYQRQRFKQ